jgi:hypothetical protein
MTNRNVATASAALSQCTTEDEVKEALKNYLKAGGSLALKWAQEENLIDPNDYTSGTETRYDVALQVLTSTDDLDELSEDAEPTLEYSNLEDAVSISGTTWDEGFTPSPENPDDEATPYTEAEDRLLQKLNLTREDISEIIEPW